MSEHRSRRNTTVARAVAGASVLVGAVVFAGCALLSGFDFSGYSPAATDAGSSDSGAPGDTSQPPVTDAQGHADVSAQDASPPRDASPLPDVAASDVSTEEAPASDDASACSAALVNDGSSTTMLSCQSGPCTVGQEICCIHNSSPDVCVDAATMCIGDGVPIGCYSARDCDFGVPDPVCCLVRDDAGLPAGSQCTPGACCASAYVLCGTSGGGSCPAGSQCSAAVDIAGMIISRCN